jgi:hypothetical protein
MIELHWMRFVFAFSLQHTSQRLSREQDHAVHYAGKRHRLSRMVAKD